MSADCFFRRGRHRYDAGLGNGRAFEALVDGKAENERKAGGQAAFQLRRDLRKPAVARDGVLARLRVCCGSRLVGELIDVVGPRLLAADTLLHDALNAVANLRAGVDIDRPLDDALVVVDEQPRGREVRS